MKIQGISRCLLYHSFSSFLQSIVPLFFPFPVLAESPCGNTTLSAPRGFIVSPNYPKPYLDEVDCVWEILSPSKSILKITILDLDIDIDRSCLNSTCCKQWLSVPHEGGRGVINLCGYNSTLTTITVSQERTYIKYHTSRMMVKRGKGFKIEYTIDSQLCQPHEMECTNGECVSKDNFCNGIADCGDGSDEKDCNLFLQSSLKYEMAKRKPREHTSFIESESNRICPEGRIPCPLTPSRCYSELTDVCNDKFDCPNGEDEVGCKPGCRKQIACSSGIGCYYPERRCDSVRDCKDNSDETDCLERPGPCVALQFTCLNGVCVSGSLICDGNDDCGDLSDEANCAKSSFMTAAIMGLSACIFLFCIGLSCLYRVYTARLRASASFVHQLEPESVDDDFIYREPPPAYSVAINDARVISYPANEVTERFFDADQTPRTHRSRSTRRNRRRHHSSGTSETSTPRSRPRPSAPPNSMVSVPAEPRFQPKINDCNKTHPSTARPTFQHHIELCGFGFQEGMSHPRTNEHLIPTSSCPNESPCSSPSLSPSRESVTSSTSLEDQEDLVRSCQS